MKLTIAMLTLVLSANVFAASVLPYSVWGLSTTATVWITSTTDFKVQAAAILNDSQEMLNTGNASLFLSQKIQETQSLNEGISEAEALDILIESAQSVLAE